MHTAWKNDLDADVREGVRTSVCVCQDGENGISKNTKLFFFQYILYARQVY